MAEIHGSDEAVLSLWAKSAPYHPLWCHMLDVAAVCERLADRFRVPGTISLSKLLLIAALHDVGKADPHFQSKWTAGADLLSTIGLELPCEQQAFRHEARSAEWLLGTFEHGGYGVQVLARALRGHHGDFRAPGGGDDPDDYPQRFTQWESLRCDLADLVARAMAVDAGQLSIVDMGNASAFGAMLSGLMVLSDWVASNDAVYGYPGLDHRALPSDYWATAREEAAKAVNLLGLDSTRRINPPGRPPLFIDVWPQCTALRPSQRAVEQAVRDGISRGLAIIEAPTGEGKTEAAIYLAEAWGATGAYLALPTMATSNQMHSRYRDFMRRYHQEVADPHLVHGMAWLVDGPSSAGGASTFGSDPDEEEIISREWFQNAKRALLASDGVGTIDQALMSVLNVKFGFLRLFALSSKTLIIDEVHAYDEYMTVLIERLLQWCRALSIPVIMLSATLSAAQKSRLLAAYTGADPQCASAEVQPYPLLTFAPLEGQAIEREVAADHRLDRRIEVRRHPGMLDDVQAVAQLAIEQTDAGGCACVFMNTVKQAQAVYRELKRLVEGSELEADILLFHSRYRAERRGQIENEVVGLFGKESGGNDSPSRPRRAILVATQVVEQSLDLDFDVMISQLAPIDLLLQRCGRLWRHERGPRPTGSTPTMHILLPDPQSLDLGLTGRIYHAEPLLRTIALLSARDWFDVPADLRALVEGCYGGAPIPPGVIPDDLLDAAAQSRAELLGDYGQRARTHLIPEPNPRVFELAEMPRPVGEHDDGERTSYFRAQTRIGGDTRSVLILHDPEMVVQTRSARPPDRGALQSLFLQEVKVPGWWLNDLVPGVGFDPLVDGPRWLRGRTVMAMTGGQWQGTRNGRTVTISDDPELGLTMTMEESNGSV